MNQFLKITLSQKKGLKSPWWANSSDITQSEIIKWDSTNEMTNNILNTINMPRHDRRTIIRLNNKFDIHQQIPIVFKESHYLYLNGQSYFLFFGGNVKCLIKLDTQKATIIYFFHDFIINNRLKTKLNHFEFQKRPPTKRPSPPLLDQLIYYATAVQIQNQTW